MVVKKKSIVSPLVPVETLLDRYFSLRDEKKTIEAELKKLSDEIKEAAERTGTKDDKGSYYAEAGNYIFGKVAKKSVSFDEDKAFDFVRMKGFTDCIVTVESLNEEAIEKRINSGDISYEELEGITTTKVTYAVDVKKKEEMPTVEETVLPSAASRKYRGRL